MTARDTLLEVLRRHGHHGLEIEWRIGRKLDREFVPGVSREEWTAVKNRMDAHGFQKEELVTVEHVARDGYKKIVYSDGRTTWMNKFRIAHLDAEEFRLSFAKEQFLHEPPKQQHQTIVHTRHKERITYFFKIWKVDMTRVTSNDPDNLDNDMETFEIEIELADVGALFMYTVDHIVSWGEEVVARVMMRDMSE